VQASPALPASKVGALRLQDAGDSNAGAIAEAKLAHLNLSN